MMYERGSVWRLVVVSVTAGLVGGLHVSGAADTCLQGVRPATAGEKAFHVQTLARLRAAMPEPPAGWRVLDETEVRAPQFACIGQERRPLALEYVRRLAPAVLEAGDSAGERGGAAAMEPPAAAVRILVRVNAAAEPLDDTWEPFETPHATLAFRGGNRETGVSAVRLLLGDWWWDPEDPTAPRGRRRAYAAFATEAPHTRVQVLAVDLDGPSSQVEALLARLDLPALAALVRPVP
jgi:hypothetical protein